MSQSGKLPSHSGKPSVAMTWSDESPTPVRRPDSPRPQISGLPDTRINLLTGCEYVDDKKIGSWEYRNLRREESIRASTRFSPRMGRTGGYSENCNILKTDARQTADDFGRCAQTLAEAKLNLERANRIARTIWTMNSLKKSIEPRKETTAAVAGVASDSPQIKVNNRTRRSASTSSVGEIFAMHRSCDRLYNGNEQNDEQLLGDFERKRGGKLSEWEFNINVPVHARAFGDSVDHLSSSRLRKKTTTGYTASGTNCMNNGTRVNLRGDAGSIQKLNPASSCDLLFGSIAAGGVENDYKQAANFPAQSPFDDLVHHIEYNSPHSNPHNKNSSRISTSLRPSIDPLQRPSHRPCILTLDSTLPQNLSSISNNPPSLTLPRDTSSRPTFTSLTNSNNRKPIQTPASPRPILSTQCPELNLCHNLNLSSTLPQASSSHTNFSSLTISPGANLNITIMYSPDPTAPNEQYHEVRQPRIVSPPDSSLCSARRGLIHRSCLQYRNLHQKLKDIPLLQWSEFECRRWIFKFLIMEERYEPKAAFRQSQKFHGTGSNLYRMRFPEWVIMIGQYLVAFEIRLRLYRNAALEHIASGPQHEPDADA